MPFVFEMHCHTAEVSPCARISAVEGVARYHALGYDGIVTTDHFFDGYFNSLGEMPWEKKVDRFLEGYEAAKREAGKVGMTVLMGAEFRFTENSNDYLVYGLTRDILVSYPEAHTAGLEAFRAFAREKGLLIVQAHPFRPFITPAAPALLDGVEVVNANIRHDSRNHLARAFAEKNGLFGICGSDFHQAGDEGRAALLFDERPTSSEALVSLLRTGRYGLRTDERDEKR